jgi:ubiquitin-conjugating enzyme E2 Z
MSNKRALADYNELQKPLYSDSGIFYHLINENITQGYACIFGPSDSPYEDCPMIYEIKITDTYPFDPPKVKFLTYDGRTRFHPNMYVDGKVCLSILGTWSGPSWASTMRISTVLVTLQSLMDNMPLRHEPGYENREGGIHEAYAKFIENACLNYTINLIKNVKNQKSLPEPLIQFKEEFERRIPGILERFEKRLEKLSEETENHFSGLPYGLVGRTNYNMMLADVLKLKTS